MDIDKYGPFATIVAVAGFLIATFGVLLFKMMGNLKTWSWLAGDTQPVTVALGARLVAVAVMAVTFVKISPSNYEWFGVGAIICAVLGLVYLTRFNKLRNLYVVAIREVGSDGQQLRHNGKPVSRNVVIGPERDMKSDVRVHYQEARSKHPGLTLVDFMSGYGTPPNQPDSIWTREQLAKLKNQLTLSLTYVALCAVLMVYLAAFIIEVFSRTK